MNEDLIEKALSAPRALSHGELVRLLAVRDPAEARPLFDAARTLRERCSGRCVSIRGLVEAGNICAKDCLYCGIRRSNEKLARYRLSADEIVRVASFAAERNYASLVIQSGEIESEANTAFYEEVLRRIAPLNLGVTLSLGEQSEETYRRWKEAGAARYLLRIETSSASLYARLHPASHSWTRRVECLRSLKRLGYQLGTGVMCGLPGQTWDDLAADVEFFAAVDADMLGMGPYIPHPDTPLGREVRAPDSDPRCVPPASLFAALKLIAVSRLYLHDVNIAAATALQALSDDGRERGLMAGANVVMPNLTDTSYRAGYRLYAGKPELDERDDDARSDFERRLAALGLEIAYGVRGDSPHFRRGERIGIFGGSFNPIHAGHLRIARQAVADHGLDLLYVVPAKVSPFKTEAADPAYAATVAATGFDDATRWRCVTAACADDPKLVPCDLELTRGGVSYAIDTVRAIAARHPGAELSYVIGEDSAPGLPRWKDWAELRRLCRFVVYPRTRESSTEIRRRLAAGESVADMVPDCVSEILRTWARTRR